METKPHLQNDSGGVSEQAGVNIVNPLGKTSRTSVSITCVWGLIGLKIVGWSRCVTWGVYYNYIYSPPLSQQCSLQSERLR